MKVKPEVNNLVLLFFYLPIAIFIFLFLMAPKFIYLVALNFALGPTIALLKPDILCMPKRKSKHNKRRD